MRGYRFVLLFFLLTDVPGILSVGVSEVRSCVDAARELRERGLSDIPEVRTPISGEHLRICPQEYTCCPSETEQRLSEESVRDLARIVNETVSYPTGVLTKARKKFQEFFLALLDSSENSLAAMFALSYGHLYSQNAALFSTLFSELRAYYMGGGAARLAEALSEFWAALLERTLRLLLPHYELSADYMECAARRAEELRPFGDIPRKLRIQVTRALGAARTLVQGLATASDIVSRATKTVPPPDCLRAAMRMWYCPLCRGHTGLLPCHGLCLNVMKGCLAHQADMDGDWNSLIDGLQEVAERLTGPFNVELATESISVKISEAIMTLQEESVQLTAQIFQSCGTPRPSRTKRSPHQEPRRTFQVYSNEEKPTSAAGTNIDRLVRTYWSVVAAMSHLSISSPYVVSSSRQVSDVVSKLRQLRGLWKLLPLSLCSDHRVSAGLSNQDKCWNGQTRGRYLPQVTGDGVVNQINNPEVELPMSPPDPRTRQLGLQLRVVRSKLKAAYSGRDSETQDPYDEGSGGSGGGEPVTEKPVIKVQGGGGERKERPGKDKKQGAGGRGRGGRKGGGRNNDGAGALGSPTCVIILMTLVARLLVSM
ncbi:glypican-2 isoform X3 [Hyla sarda]|nr:glypican-2 isoform X3 [Hyla sarda]XP_056426127.1 glypican-2 isoform X3 [Hyla sarda]XP_056426128.1 glypican-2 isoform X3 [Hyla sarda]XP_056426130.1 glypican-2 isoform X3 [Hyla sarda]XP_056426131.1 glypican-2 isoform X3 [Hyla sarda]